MTAAAEREPEQLGHRRVGHDLWNERGAVNSIRLVGAPVAIIIDKAALLDRHNELSPSVLAKLECLARYDNMTITCVSESELSFGELQWHVEQVRAIPEQFDFPAVGIFGSTWRIQTEIYSWYVGPGTPPKHMRTTRLLGAHGSNTILGLLGMSLVQERAGAAFRAVGHHKPIPGQHVYNTREILDGLSRAVEPFSTIPQQQVGEAEAGIAPSAQRLIEHSVGVIERASGRNGAIAAARRGTADDSPDYWFFWQRDASQAVVALAGLSNYDLPSAVRRRVDRILASFTAFIETWLAEVEDVASFSVSRFRMDGQPILGYGNPQHDGPAHTALALMVLLRSSQPERAFEAVKPLLEWLVSRVDDLATFDGWELAFGRIFASENLVRKALICGSEIASTCGSHVAAERFAAAAETVRIALSDFFHTRAVPIRSGRDFIVPWFGTISGLDCSVIGSVLFCLELDSDFLNVEDERLVNLMEVLRSEFSNMWSRNQQMMAVDKDCFGFGRFPEDTNDGLGSTGAGPWAITTLWSAQYYLRLIQRMDLLKTGQIGELSRDRILARADGHLAFVLAHMTTYGLSEQFDGESGEPRGARDLVWAHAELINTLTLRQEISS